MTNNEIPEITDDEAATIVADAQRGSLEAAVADIIANVDDDVEWALDLIIDFADEFTRYIVDAIMAAAYAVDPTLSGVGADIRDTIRDNTEFDI